MVFIFSGMNFERFHNKLTTLIGVAAVRKGRKLVVALYIGQVENFDKVKVGNDFSIENLHAAIERSRNSNTIRIWILIPDRLVKGLFCSGSFRKSINEN